MPHQSRRPNPSTKRVKNHSIAGVRIQKPVLIRSKDLRIIEDGHELVLEEVIERYAKKTGGGEYGSVYLMPLDWESRAVVQRGCARSKCTRQWSSSRGLNLLTALKDRISNSVYGPALTKSTKYVIIKVSRPQRNESWPAFIKRNSRENAAHAAVQKAKKSIVPTLFFAGSVSGAYISVMTHAGGNTLEAVTLKDYIKMHGKIPEKLYSNLHNAVVTLTKIGLVHGDLHNENVMVLPDLSVKLIDFGFAVQLPPEYTREVRKVVDTSTDKAWDLVKSYVDAVQLQRIPGLSWYNPNAKALRVWRSYADAGRNVLSGRTRKRH